MTYVELNWIFVYMTCDSVVVIGTIFSLVVFLVLIPLLMQDIAFSTAMYRRRYLHAVALFFEEEPPHDK